MQWAPVCGTDGETYSTACAANCKGVGIAYNGECNRGGGGFGGGGTGTGSRSNPRQTWPPNNGPAATPPTPAGTWYYPGTPNFNSVNNNNLWANPGRWGSNWWPRRLLHSSRPDATRTGEGAAAQQHAF